jgi:dTDP-4-amino-4,6-dideoxygalactose transaminase
MRQRAATRYFELLSDVEEISLPWTDPQATHVHHLYVVVTPKRDELASWLNARDVSTLVHYPKCVHEHKAYQELNHMVGGFPVSERLARQSLSLPMHPFLTSSEQEYVADCIKRFFDRQP